MSEPVLHESLLLLRELPPEVPVGLVSVLIWLRLDPEATNVDLAKWTRSDESSVKRWLRIARENQLIIVQYLYKIGGVVTPCFEPPNSEGAPAGRFMGTHRSLNYVQIKQIREVDRLAVNPPNAPSQGSLAAHGEPTIGGSQGALGREGMGHMGGSSQNLSTGLFRQPPILTLTKRALNDLCLAAQRNLGVKSPVNIVWRGDDPKAIRRFIDQMPANLRWAPWERVVNLFSFWVERHSRKKLKFEFKTFCRDADDWMPSLIAWENETMDQMRSIVPVVESEDDPQPDAGEASKIREAIESVQRHCLTLYKKSPKVKDIEKFVSRFDPDVVTDLADAQAVGIKDPKERVRAMLAFFADGAGMKIVEFRVNLQRWEDWDKFTEGLDKATSLLELNLFCHENGWQENIGKLDGLPPIPPSGISETAEELFAIALERLKGTSEKNSDDAKGLINNANN